MRYFSLIVALLVSFSICAQEATLSLAEIQQLTTVDQTAADNLLKSKGFSISSISGVLFSYTNSSEKIDFVSSPRSVTFSTISANTYIKLNDGIAKEYQLSNSQDAIVYNNQTITATSFSKEGMKISLWTSNENPTKFFIQSSVSTNSTSKNNIEEQPKPFAFSDIKGLRQEVKNNKAKSSSLPSGTGFPTKKTRITFGAGLYRVPSLSTVNGKREYDDYTETLYALNFGFEVSKFPEMQKKNNFFVNTRVDINFTSFLDMQFSYLTTKPDDPDYVTNLEILFLTKHYATIGLISEIRKKNISFLMCFAPGLNWNRGNYEGEKVNVFGGVVQMGEYVQHTFRSKSKEKDSMFIRLGFEQFFSFGLGYIGQFALTFGI